MLSPRYFIASFVVFMLMATGGKEYNRVRSKPPPQEDLYVGAAANYCRTNADLHPGKMVIDDNFVRWATLKYRRAVWVPDRCKLLRAEELDVKTCFEGLRQVWYGDSLTRDVFIYSWQSVYGGPPAKRMYKEGTPWDTEKPLRAEYDGYDFKPTQGMLKFYWSTHSAWPQLYDHPDSQQDLPTADLVWVGAGSWDMGMDGRPVDVFFRNYTKRVRDIKAKARPGARVILFPLYYFNVGLLPEVLKWNTPTKIQAYRHAFHMIAACEGVEVLDAKMITEGAGNNTRDGIHFDPFIGGSMGDVFLNAVCREPRLDLTPRVACDYEGAMARWREIPELGVSPAP